LINDQTWESQNVKSSNDNEGFFMGKKTMIKNTKTDTTNIGQKSDTTNSSVALKYHYKGYIPYGETPLSCNLLDLVGVELVL
jgi:hypothetical protein|tara:strand:- start:902 stop:1147 length:246 start_codon:yes stop_codon:yes gene_type:complete